MPSRRSPQPISTASYSAIETQKRRIHSLDCSAYRRRSSSKTKRRQTKRAHGLTLRVDRSGVLLTVTYALTPNAVVCPCQKAAYCSRKCQIAHYPIHKTTCTVRSSTSKKN
mmetsp:Transcript_15884/g.39451  ORF Transcript_15884/g.39451 Transcript_15884/m.39451 type:complete len:111 (-) Transcript_15884:36-368(-)